MRPRFTECWPALLGLGCATVVQLSLLWDISWHTSIGRDSFWTPAHIGLYLGGAIPGLAFGALVLHTTFFGSPEARARSVTIAGLKAPLGVWVSLWGSVAMLAAGPFDGWWHVSYGVDLKVISPPHILLLAGVTATHLGALLLVAALANRSSGGEARLAARCYEYGVGVLMLMAALFGLEMSYPAYMHGPMFYGFAAAAFPLWLVAAGAAGSRWPATRAALWYSGFRILMTWLLPLFPATPRLGPVHVDVTHMVPTGFPLLLVVPALAFDWIGRRPRVQRSWFEPVALGGIFFATFVAVQWPFAEFLMTPAARGWVFAADNFRYNLPPTTYTAHFRFIPWRSELVPQWLVILGAAPVAILSAQVGLWWRAYLRMVQR